MTRLMIFGTVGRSLNPTEKYHDFSRLNWVRSFQPPYLLHVSNGRSVVYDALSFMKGVRDDSLSHGAYLMKYVVIFLIQKTATPDCLLLLQTYSGYANSYGCPIIV